MVTRLRSLVRPKPLGVDQPRNSVAELHLRILDGMSSDDGNAGLEHLFRSAMNDLAKHLRLDRSRRKSYDGEREDRASSHGINIAE